MKLDVTHNWTEKMWDWPLQHADGVAKVHNDIDGFEVQLEMQAYTPKEISVQVQGRNVMIDCVHEERSDKHGTVRREVSAPIHAISAAAAPRLRAARRRGHAVAQVAPHRQGTPADHRRQEAEVNLLPIMKIQPSSSCR